MKTAQAQGAAPPAEPGDRAEVTRLREELARLAERLAALEKGAPAAAAAPPPAPRTATPAPAPAPEAVPEDVLMVLSAAIAAFLGKRPIIRQIRIVSSEGWAHAGRVSIQGSHALPPR